MTTNHQGGDVKVDWETGETPGKVLSLYRVAAEYAFLMDLDVEPEAFDEALAQLGGEISGRGGNIMRVIRMLEGQANDFQQEADRIAANAKALKNRANRLSEYLEDVMKVAGIRKIEAGTFTAALQRNSTPTCEILDEAAIPRAYQVIVPVSWRPDRKAISDFFKKTGSQVRGAVVSYGEHLRIR